MAHRRAPFPRGPAGAVLEFAGAENLVLLDACAAGHISSAICARGRLDAARQAAVLRSVARLAAVMPLLSAEPAAYCARLPLPCKIILDAPAE